MRKVLIILGLISMISCNQKNKENKHSDKVLTKEMTERQKFDTSKLTEKEKNILNSFYKRREMFDSFVKQEKIDRHTCPGCGYPTLSERGEYEICEVCNWEDDGLDEKQANEIWGGPNQGLTLIENRLNIGKTLNHIADSLNGTINMNPKDVMKAFIEHNKRMNAFDEEKMMGALRDDPIWKEWINKVR